MIGSGGGKERPDLGQGSLQEAPCLRRTAASLRPPDAPRDHSSDRKWEREPPSHGAPAARFNLGARGFTGLSPAPPPATAERRAPRKRANSPPLLHGATAPALHPDPAACVLVRPEACVQAGICLRGPEAGGRPQGRPQS